MNKNKFLGKTVVNTQSGKSKREKELIIDDFGGMSSAVDTLAREGRDIVHKHYVFSCGEVGESERARYSKSLFLNSPEYNELNNRLLQAGL